ncbi:MAG: hypothetical protein LBV67_05125 [Streptococcaceae bacterium]|jgi:RNA polymerase sigma factor (sigma-70 family)|nr:hypothetical protein [Streptococcaceae bacterium]
MEKFEDYIPLVLHLRTILQFTLLEDEDFFQEARITFEKSKESYEGKVSFGSYFKKVLKNRLIQIIRHENAKKRQGNLQTVSFEEYFSVDERQAQYSDTTFEKEFLTYADLDELWSRFTSQEASIFEEYLNDKHRTFNSLSKTEKQHIYNVKKKMREFLKGN